MARPPYYVPAIGRFLVKVIHHEAKSRGIPMTRLVDSLLADALRGGEAWRMAEAETAADPAGHPRDGSGAGVRNGRGCRYEPFGEESFGPGAV